MCRGSGTIVNAVSASGLFRPSIIEDTSILLTNYYYTITTVITTPRAVWVQTKACRTPAA